MAVIPFGEYRPDVSDLNRAYTGRILNVIPRSDGYGPIRQPNDYTAALGEACRGYFFARNADRSVTIFAGTSTKLYKLDNTTLTWVDVSVGGGSYTSLDTNRQWRFAQFNNYVFATQRNAVLQRYDLTSSSAFSNAPGSPPQAGNIAVVNRFVVLCDLLSSPYRIQWSGLNDTTNWTAGTNYSDYQDLPTGGVPLAVVGGEVGIILQDNEVRRMMYAAGSDVVFQIDRLHEKLGIISAEAVTSANNRVFAYTTRGFLAITIDGQLEEIGEERVNRRALDVIDQTKSHLMVASADPESGVVLWTYKSEANSGDTFDGALLYNYIIKQWAPIELTGEYITTLSAPGLTLEALDAAAPGSIAITGAANNGSGLIRITVGSTSTLTTGDVKTISGVGGVTAANGTWTITVISGTTFDLQGSTFAGVYTSGGYVAGSLDALAFSLDQVSAATLPALSVANTNHAIGFLWGDFFEATLTTAEQELDQGYRVDVNGLWPISDAPTVYGFITKRDTLKGAATDGSESASNDDGFCPLLENTRLARGGIRIPAGTAWTFATGVDPSFRRAGRY